MIDRFAFLYAMFFLAILFPSIVLANFDGLDVKDNPFYSVEEIAYIESHLTSHLLDQKFNGQVLVARYGKVIYNKSFGFADFRNNTPVTSRTSFQLASITKPFTATAVLLLQQQGKLDIDDLVTKYVREFPYRKITVRHLLSHTSGIPNYFQFLTQMWKGKKSFPSNENLLKAFTSRKPNLKFEPGTEFEYSNSGYAFLALIIERVSGQTYASFIKRNIFEPLEMHDSFVYHPSSRTIPKNRAYGFRRARRGLVIANDAKLDGIMGDKGIFSTANDLYKWDVAISQNKILTTSAWNSAFEPAILANDSLVNYGLGWRLQSLSGNRVAHHPGWWAGFRTSFKRFIDNLGTLIVLCNDDSSVANLVKELQDIVFYKELEIFNKPDPENGTEVMEIQ